MLSCGNLDSVLDIDIEKGTVTVESGVSLDTLLRVLLPLGWFPMVIPGTSYVTVGGAIASDIHGKFRHGSFADYVERDARRHARARGVRYSIPTRTPRRSGRPAAAWASPASSPRRTLKLQPVETSRIVCDTERTHDVDDCMDADARAAITTTATPSRGSTAWRAAGTSDGRC